MIFVYFFLSFFHFVAVKAKQNQTNKKESIKNTQIHTHKSKGSSRSWHSNKEKENFCWFPFETMCVKPTQSHSLTLLIFSLLLFLSHSLSNSLSSCFSGFNYASFFESKIRIKKGKSTLLNIPLMTISHENSNLPWGFNSSNQKIKQNWIGMNLVNGEHQIGGGMLS